MALTLQELDAYTHRYIVPKTTDVIFQNSPVFTRLHSRNMEKFEGGLSIQRPLMVGELNGDALGRGEEMNIDAVVTDTALVLDMKLYYVNIPLFGFDSIANNGPMAVFSQVESKFHNASRKMAKMLSTSLYLAAQDAGRSKHLSGFEEWVDDGNSYPSIGGITRSDLLANGTVGALNSYVATLTQSTQMRDINRACSQARFGADQVDLLAVTNNGWDMIWEAAQPSQRYMSEQNDLGKIGFGNFRINSADVVVDPYMPTGANGRAFGLNTKYIEWFFSTNPKFQFAFTGFKEVQRTIDVAGQFLVANQLVMPNPRTSFKLKSTLY